MNIKIKKDIFFLLLLTSYGFWSCSSKEDIAPVDKTVKGVSVKCMTYNIYSGQKKGISAIADVINEIDPDIVGLEEVETGSTLVPENVPKVLLELTNMKYAYFVKTYNVNGGKYGNLILSKTQFTDSATFALSEVISTPYPRAFGYVKTQKDGKKFYFAVTHLDYQQTVNKQLQVDEILENIADINNPMIFVGDFNSHADSDPMATLLTKFTLGCLNKNYGLTTPTPIPTEAIDYLMYAPADSITPIAYNVYYDAYTESDHFPVVATFKIHE